MPIGLHTRATDSEMRAFYACCREDPYGDSPELLGKALAAKYGIEWIEAGEPPKGVPAGVWVED